MLNLRLVCYFLLFIILIMILILNMHFLFQAKGLYVDHSVLGVSCLWIASLDK